MSPPGATKRPPRGLTPTCISFVYTYLDARSIAAAACTCTAWNARSQFPRVWAALWRGAQGEYHADGDVEAAKLARLGRLPALRALALSAHNAFGGVAKLPVEISVADSNGYTYAGGAYDCFRTVVLSASSSGASTLAERFTRDRAPVALPAGGFHMDIRSTSRFVTVGDRPVKMQVTDVRSSAIMGPFSTLFTRRPVGVLCVADITDLSSVEDVVSKLHRLQVSTGAAFPSKPLLFVGCKADTITPDNPAVDLSAVCEHFSMPLMLVSNTASPAATLDAPFAYIARRLCEQNPVPVHCT